MFRVWAFLQSFRSACSFKRGNWGVEDIKTSLKFLVRDIACALRGHPADWHFELESVAMAYSSKSVETLFEECLLREYFLRGYASRAKRHFSICNSCRIRFAKTMAEDRLLKSFFS